MKIVQNMATLHLFTSHFDAVLQQSCTWDHFYLLSNHNATENNSQLIRLDQPHMSLLIFMSTECK